ncbi:Crp/Fnr family transcriptional regulator [Novosphingobium soli]|uniref:Crp/Fnr family transcriptional regulator n=1 Tax=Novosphingobium soli TaxID=574956 RepID=A0ABV6CTG3_9SPHN
MRSSHAADQIRHFRRHEHLARKEEVQDKVFRIEEGWACRYCLLADGRRQITALFLPGDYCEPQWLLAGRSDLPVIALTEVKVTEMPLAGIHAKPGDGVMKLLAGVVKTLNRQTDWIVSLGRKSATERVGSLLSELYARLREINRVMGDRCTIPLTQQDIADIVGLTPVHVNRVLGDLRQRGLVQFSGKTLVVPHPEELSMVAAAA